MRSSEQVKITELRKFKHGCGLQGCNICTGREVYIPDVESMY